MPRGMSARLTHEQEQEIVELYKQGQSTTEIRTAYGLKHDSRIYAVLHRYNVTLNRGKNGGARRGPKIRKLPPEEVRPEDFTDQPTIDRYRTQTVEQQLEDRARQDQAVENALQAAEQAQAAQDLERTLVQLATREVPVKMVSTNNSDDDDTPAAGKKRYRVTVKVRIAVEADSLVDAAKKAMGYNGATEVLAAVRIG